MAARSYGQHSAVVAALELVGERWALLIVRDLLVGPRRYTDLKTGLPRIPTNILSTRLKELQQAGVVRRLPLAHGLGYMLTDYGRDLEPVILALGRWGFRALGERADGENATTESLTIDLRSAFHADAARALPATTYGVHVGNVALIVLVDAGVLTVRTAAPSAALSAPLAAVGVPSVQRVSGVTGVLVADLVVMADDVCSLLAGEWQTGTTTLRVLAGDARLLTRFSATFQLEREPAASVETTASALRVSVAVRVGETPSHPASPSGRRGRATYYI
ncbi:transcriptional regulator [Cryobacterium melibiosiphilum]|uniref:Transcriptional regulator n=1 Tax=Cryobacterium melibiosiphilum TaxID=995039 RepID=A0A3A5MLL3_9MICO|nr:helix-turn-helix domain-containing protein [Cryobacterium melibiosiphilum]RJT85628.1 transcriptional regulator [Cryobacterium melibiosiphilum]